MVVGMAFGVLFTFGMRLFGRVSRVMVVVALPPPQATTKKDKAINFFMVLLF
jgi:hypothetical protein